MKKIITSLCFFLSACSAQGMAKSPTTTTSNVQERVVRVIDGDTFTIAAEWNPYKGLIWKVRVMGIDTPEKGKLAHCEREKKLSAAAQKLATTLIAESGQLVRLTQIKHDKYGGRFDSVVILSDGRNLGDELIKAKLAKMYNGNGPKPNWCN